MVPKYEAIIKKTHGKYDKLARMPSWEINYFSIYVHVDDKWQNFAKYVQLITLNIINKSLYSQLPPLMLNSLGVSVQVDNI